MVRHTVFYIVLFFVKSNNQSLNCKYIFMILPRYRRLSQLVFYFDEFIIALVIYLLVGTSSCMSCMSKFIECAIRITIQVIVIYFTNDG